MMSLVTVWLVHTGMETLDSVSVNHRLHRPWCKMVQVNVGRTGLSALAL